MTPVHDKHLGRELEPHQCVRRSFTMTPVHGEVPLKVTGTVSVCTAVVHFDPCAQTSAPEGDWNHIGVHGGREATGKKKKDKPSILKICPVWLLNQDLNLGPSD